MRKKNACSDDIITHICITTDVDGMFDSLLQWFPKCAKAMSPDGPLDFVITTLHLASLIIIANIYSTTSALSLCILICQYRGTFYPSENNILITFQHQHKFENHWSTVHNAHRFAFRYFNAGECLKDRLHFISFYGSR